MVTVVDVLESIRRTMWADCWSYNGEIILDLKNPFLTEDKVFPLHILKSRPAWKDGEEYFVLPDNWGWDDEEKCFVLYINPFTQIEVKFNLDSREWEARLKVKDSPNLLINGNSFKSAPKAFRVAEEFYNRLTSPE